MKNFARIENGKVAERLDAEELPPFHPSLHWEPCAANVQEGWDFDGTTFTSPKALPPPVPASVTMRQARLALLKVGKLDAVNSALAAMPGETGAAARIEWEFSSTVERTRGYVGQIGVGLGMTDKQLDDLFILAATL